MNKIKLGQEPAFMQSQTFDPRVDELDSSQMYDERMGMCKRELIAKDAMCAILAAMPHSAEDTVFMLETMNKSYGNMNVSECIAKEALLYADALLTELSK